MGGHYKSLGGGNWQKLDENGKVLEQSHDEIVKGVGKAEVAADQVLIPEVIAEPEPKPKKVTKKKTTRKKVK